MDNEVGEHVITLTPPGSKKLCIGLCKSLCSFTSQTPAEERRRRRPQMNPEKREGFISSQQQQQQPTCSFSPQSLSEAPTPSKKEMDLNSAIFFDTAVEAYLGGRQEGNGTGQGDKWCCKREKHVLEHCALESKSSGVKESPTLITEDSSLNSTVARRMIAEYKDLINLMPFDDICLKGAAQMVAILEVMANRFEQQKITLEHKQKEVEELNRFRSENAKLVEKVQGDEVKLGDLMRENTILHQKVWQSIEEYTMVKKMSELYQEEAEEAKRVGGAANRAAVEAKREAEEAKREAEEAKREAEEAKREAEEAKREAEEAKRDAEEAKRDAEEAKRDAEEAKRDAEEAKRAAKDNKKAAEEAKLAAEENKRAAEEAVRLAEGSMRAAEDEKKVSEEATRAAEDNMKAAKEAMMGAADNRKAAKEAMMAAEDNKKAAEEAHILVEEAMRSAMDNEKATKKAKITVESYKKAAEEATRLADEATRDAEYNKKAAKEAKMEAEDKKKASEEAIRLAEEAKKATEDHKKFAEDARIDLMKVKAEAQFLIADANRKASEAVENWCEITTALQMEKNRAAKNAIKRYKKSAEYDEAVSMASARFWFDGFNRAISAVQTKIPEIDLSGIDCKKIAQEAVMGSGTVSHSKGLPRKRVAGCPEGLPGRSRIAFPEDCPRKRAGGVLEGFPNKRPVGN